MDFNFDKEVDLHLFNPANIKEVLTEFINQALKKEYTLVRIIHGKGKSQLKLTVYRFLEGHQKVIAYGDDGANWGATLVRLKKIK